MIFSLSKIAKFFLISSFTFVITSCKNETLDVMPNIQFQQTLSPGVVSAMGVYDAVLTEGGYAGLIVFKKSEGEFMAFERLCPYYPNDTVAVVLDKSKTIATCPRCKSTFSLILDGVRTSGPARISLKTYQYFYAYGRLTISN